MQGILIQMQITVPTMIKQNKTIKKSRPHFLAKGL
jgi:hypothetical protein